MTTAERDRIKDLTALLILHLSVGTDADVLLVLRCLGQFANPCRKDIKVCPLSNA